MGYETRIPNGEGYPVSVKYTVRQGDTLTTISKATKIPISILAKDNNILDVNKIQAGQTIMLNYHPESWETINGEEINTFMPNPADQEDFFAEMDGRIQSHYEQVATDGAQKHIDTVW
jgi:LysM repeat protein